MELCTLRSQVQRKCCIPVSGPVHELICDQHGNGPVEDLTLCSPVGVEDCGICGAGKGALAVVGKTIGDDSLLWGRAWWGKEEALVSCV